ncbi:MAG: tRNA adenosine(34) deaminase TadA [Gammaproteobacteria bacterium]|nr:tRNA adenosine(34) deaminase TadA [Gammaproteobacteria bacterium]
MLMEKEHGYWMERALEQAQIASELGEVPIGAVLVANGAIIGAGFNQPISSHDASAHAEICALRQASQIRQNYRLPDTTLYVTIEPCTMCVGAMVHARIKSLVFGAREPRAGAVVSQQQLLDAQFYNHKVSYVEGVLSNRCAALIQDFFQSKRKG